MVRPKITNTLKGSLGETYYKELCSQKGWAYCSLEVLHNCKDLGSVVFKTGFERMRVNIPNSIRPEVERIARPSNRIGHNPSFVFDYLACKVSQTSTSQTQYPRRDDFCWAEVKTGLGIFSDNQYRTLSEINLPIAVFHIENVLAKPQYIDMDWDIMSGREFVGQLTKADDRRDYEDANYKDRYDNNYRSGTKSGVGYGGRSSSRYKSSTNNSRYSGVVAKYDNKCGVCNKKIRKGVDRIIQNSAGDWVHPKCA